MSRKSLIGVVVVTAVALMLFFLPVSWETHPDAVLASVDTTATELRPPDESDSVLVAPAPDADVISLAAPAMRAPGPTPSTAPAHDPRMIQGDYPFIGYGADTFQNCAPRDGGDWTVEILAVTSTTLEASGPPPRGTLEYVIEEQAWDPDADLHVVVFETGGFSQTRNGIHWPVDRPTKSRCAFVAGHTAPETPYQTGPLDLVSRRSEEVGQLQDIAIRGLAFLPRREHGGLIPASIVRVHCVTNGHFDQISVAFASDDMLRTVRGCARNVTMARMLCGPSGGGNRGRCGGPQASKDHRFRCGEQTWAWLFGFETVRRSPEIQCGARSPINVTNVLCYNLTDCGRVDDFSRANWRGVLSIGGPVTGCERDRAIVFFEPASPSDTSHIYLEKVESRPAPGCTWSTVTDLWDAEHTVFHYSVGQGPVSRERHGSSTPFPDPMYFVEPLPPGELETQVPFQVGANFRLQCDGSWLHRFNDLDGNSVERFKARQGVALPWESLLDYEAQMGQVSTPEGTPCPDANQNHIPDAIEARWGHSDPGHLMPDGRPAVFHWLEGLRSS